MEPIKVKYSGYIELNKINDGSDGNLIVIEALRNLPFEIKRVYYINNLENCVSARGHHAHKTLQQVIFCISGSFILGLDDNETKQEILMFRDNLGVILGPGLWHTMHSFSTNCVLLVIASDYYDPDDYIRDYGQYQLWHQNSKF